MFDFTPWSALAGGAMIGAGASLLLLASGRIAGVSGILVGLVSPQRGDVSWRVLFTVGLLVGGLIMMLLNPQAFEASPRSLGWVALAGLLVGIGTRVGGGCTSGHGVCGLSRLSIRSLVATLTFVGTGIVTATVMRWLGGS